MSRAHTSQLRIARHLVTGHRLGTVKTTWQPRYGAAASPDPIAAQATLEATLLHISHGRGSRTHPLGHVGLGWQRWYTQTWVTPHRDQLVIEASAPRNWVDSLTPPTMRDGVVDSGKCRLVVAFDEDSNAGWVIGSGGTSIVFVPERFHRGRRAVELNKRPLPTRLAGLAAKHASMSEHPTDRLLSALVRRYTLVDGFLRLNDFFNSDGHLGFRFDFDESYEDRSKDEQLRAFGIETAIDLARACLTDRFLGLSETRVVESRPDWVVIEDCRNGALLCLAGITT